MGELADKSLAYLQNTPSEQLKKDWEELKKYNEQGPDILDVINPAMRVKKEVTQEDLYKAAMLAAYNYARGDGEDEPCYDMDFYEGFKAGVKWYLQFYKE